MTQTPMQKNTEQTGRLMGRAAIAGGWTPEMKEEYDYLSACWGKLLPSAGTFTGKPNPAREQEIGAAMDAGVYRSLYSLENHGTEGDAIFYQMQGQIEAAKIMKDPVLRNSLEQLLRIGQKYLGLTVEEQLGRPGLRIGLPIKYLDPGNLYDDKEPLLPTGKDSAAA